MITTRFFINNLNYGCSFVAKLSRKKKVFLKKYLFFYKIYIICRKNVFNMEKKFCNENFFYRRKNFFNGEKYKCKCKIYIYHFKKIFFRQKISELQQYINLSYIYIHSAEKKFFNIKIY